MRDYGTKGGETWTHIKESLTPNDRLPASDVNMSVWDFERKTRGKRRTGRGPHCRYYDDQSRGRERLEKRIRIFSSNRGLDIWRRTAIHNNFHWNNCHDTRYIMSWSRNTFLASPLFRCLLLSFIYLNVSCTENRDLEILYRCKTRSTLPNAFRRKLRSWRYCLTGYSLLQYVTVIHHASWNRTLWMRINPLKCRFFKNVIKN